MKYTVELESPDYSFRAKHFVAFPQETGTDAPWIGELLHEHCFTASVKASGPLDESDCVFDFIAARDALLEILAEFDGQTLVGTKTPCVEYEIEPLREGTPGGARRRRFSFFRTVDRRKERFRREDRRNDSPRMDQTPASLLSARRVFLHPSTSRRAWVFRGSLDLTRRRERREASTISLS